MCNITKPVSLSMDRKGLSTTENNRREVFKTKVGMSWCRGKI